MLQHATGDMLITLAHETRFALETSETRFALETSETREAHETFFNLSSRPSFDYAQDDIGVIRHNYQTLSTEVAYRKN